MKTGYGIHRLKNPIYLAWLIEKLENPEVVRDISVVYGENLFRFGSIYDVYEASDMGDLAHAKVKSFTSYEHGVRFFCV